MLYKKLCIIIYILHAGQIYASVRSFVKEYGDMKATNEVQKIPAQVPDNVIHKLPDNKVLKTDHYILKTQAPSHTTTNDNSSMLPKTPTVNVQVVKIRSFSNFMYPTEAEIKNLVMEQFFNKTEFHDNPNDFHQIDVEMIDGGTSTEALYKISDKGIPKLFIKISSNSQSAQRLIDIQQGAIGRSKLKSQLNKFINKSRILPELKWVETIFIEEGWGGNKLILEVTHAAAGSSIFSILFNNDRVIKQAFSEKKDLSLSDKRDGRLLLHKNTITKFRCLSAAGKSLGAFQQLFLNGKNHTDASSWKTVAHKDLSLANIFYDPIYNHISFIDNETMQNNQNLLEDVTAFLASITRVLNPKDSPIQKGKEKEYIGYATTFLTSYIKSFPKYKQYALLQLIINHPDHHTYTDRIELPIYYSSNAKKAVLENLTNQFKTTTSPTESH